MSLMKSFAGSGLMLFCSLALSCPGVAAPLITYRLDTPKAGLMTSVAPSQRAGPATTVNDRPSGSIGPSGQAGNDNPSKALDTSSVAVHGRSISSVPSVGAGTQGAVEAAQPPPTNSGDSSENVGLINPNSGSTVAPACGHGHDRNTDSRWSPGHDRNTDCWRSPG